MTKVLHILTDSNIGGAGRYLVSYLQHRDQAQFQPVVVLPRGSALIPEIEKLAVPVVEADYIAEQSFSLKAISGLREILRREQPDLIHTHGSFSGRIAATREHIPVVVTRHSAFPVPGYLQKGPGHWLYGAMNRHYATHFIAVSPASEENLLQLGIPKDRITTMLNGGAALPPLSPEEREAKREALGIPAGCLAGGLFARLEPYKGQQLLLEAAELLKDEGRDFRLFIGGSGPEETYIREAIDTLDLAPQVQFLGFVTDMAGTLGAMDFQLNCSWGTEASSMALIEGMSLGLPTVASDYGGNPFMVEDGISGLLFRSRDSADLVEKLRRLLDDPALVARLGQGARRAYETRFTGEIFAEHIEAVYRRLLP